MGGSAVGGRLAQAALGAAARRARSSSPTATRCRPGSAREHLVLCSSYSGDTEETLAAYDDALERGAPRLVATTGGALAERARRDGAPVIPLPGGFQPRAAVGYGLVSALEAAALGGAGPSLRDEVEAAAALAETLAAEWGPDGDEDSEAKRARARAARHRPGDRGRRADRAGRLPLEVPDQRERRPARVRERAARARPQRGRRLARRGRPRPVLGRLPRGRRRAPAQRAALRAHRRRGARPARASSSASPRAARRRSSGSSRSCCSATSSRSTSPCSRAPTRSTSPRSTASRPH